MMDSTTASGTSERNEETDADYQATVLFDAVPDAVFAALTTTDGLARWWAPVTGTADEGGDLRFEFGKTNPVIKLIHVDRLQRPSSVWWTVVDCNALPEWAGTRLRFDLRARQNGGTELRFRHAGLVPKLECFASCRSGWDEFLASLHDYVDCGRGRPYGGRNSA